MNVDWEVVTLTECSNQLGCSCRTQKACHVLDSQDVGSCSNNLIREGEVVVQGVLVLCRVKQVAGVTHGYFSNSGAGFQDCLNCRTHLVNIVESIEYTEYINTCSCSFLNESLSYFLWVGGVTNRVTTTKKHLDCDVRKCLSKLGETIPGIFAEETKGNVVCCTTPGLN